MEFIAVNRNESDKAAWLEERKHYITGTDAGKLIGVSPWGGKMSVWLDKTGQAPEIKETEAMKWGKRNEGTILKAYAEEMDCKLEHVDGYTLVKSEKFPRLAASLDGWNHTLGIPVDAKNIRWKDEKWGEAFTDDFPAYYKAQLQVQMMVTGAKSAHLAVLFCGQEFVIYQMSYDEEMAAKIVEESEAFWICVESGKNPEADGSEESKDFIEAKYKEGKVNEEKAATDEIKVAIEKLIKAKKAKAEAEAEETKYANIVKNFLGKATVIPGYCTWKNNKNSIVVDWKGIAEEAMKGLSEEKQKELIEHNSSTKIGARQLRITLKGT